LPGETAKDSKTHHREIEKNKKEQNGNEGTKFCYLTTKRAKYTKKPMNAEAEPRPGTASQAKIQPVPT
jgi:hypothetical protein